MSNDTPKRRKAPLTAHQPPEMLTHMREGCNAMSKEKFKDAAKHFTFAIHSCPCNAAADPPRRPRCTCRPNLPEAAMRYNPLTTSEPSGGEIPGLYALLSTPCTCAAAAYGECPVAEYHVRALDMRAAAFEKMGTTPDRVAKDTEWALHLAPRCLEGWLRMGKLARQERRKDLAWRVWSEGLAVAKCFAKPNDVRMLKMKDLRKPLHKEFSARDPLAIMPIEIMVMIFSYLGWADGCSCLQVSRTWKNVAEATSSLWSTFRCSLVSPSYKKSFTPHRRLYAALYRGIDKFEAVSLLHDGLGKSPAKPVEFWQPLVKASRRLKLLRYDTMRVDPLKPYLPAGWGPEKPLPAWAFANLTHLSLSCIHSSVVGVILERCGHGLKHLSLDRNFAPLPLLENLVSLAVVGGSLVRSNMSGSSLDSTNTVIDTKLLAQATPNVKSLRLCAVVLAPEEEKPIGWPHVVDLSLQRVSRLPYLPNPKYLRFLEIREFLPSMPLEEYGSPPTLQIALITAKSSDLTTIGALPAKLKTLLKESIELEFLHAVAVQGFGLSVDGRPIIDEYDWLMGALSMQNLMVHDFGCHEPNKLPFFDKLYEFVSSFPKLEKVGFMDPLWEIEYDKATTRALAGCVARLLRSVREAMESEDRDKKKFGTHTRCPNGFLRTIHLGGFRHAMYAFEPLMLSALEHGVEMPVTAQSLYVAPHNSDTPWDVFEVGPRVVWDGEKMPSELAVTERDWVM